MKGGGSLGVEVDGGLGRGGVGRWLGGGGRWLGGR